MNRLSDKKILITGSAKRIGKELCQYFAHEGASLVIHCNKSKQSAEELKIDLEHINGLNHEVVQGDISSYGFTNSLFENIKDIDILINNASTFNNVNLRSEKITVAKKQFDINFWGPFNLMQNFVEQNPLKEKHIINLLDYRVYKNEIKSGTYVISKRALADLTRLAGLEWAPSVRVNGIALGFVLPPVWMPDSLMENSRLKTPMKRIVSTKEISETCMFLIESKSITGEIISLDSGMHI